MPERWLTDDIEQKKLLLYNFMPFGFSRRICAGQMLGELGLAPIMTLLIGK